MNIIQLQYLVDVGELGSFTEAAKKNHITVPAISISINQLETTLDVPLFSRTRKGVIPTTEGKKAIHHAKSILKSVEKMKYDISLSKSVSYGNIIVAAIPGLVPQLLNTTLEFRKSYPNLNVQLVEGDTTFVLNNVKKGQADMGFISFGTMHHDQALSWEPVMKDEAVLVVPKSSILRFHTIVSSSDIKNETIVLYNDPFIKMIADKLFLCDETNQVALISNSFDALLHMVIHGKAISLSTEYIIHSLPSHVRSEVITIPFKIDEIFPLLNYLWRVTKKHVEVSDIMKQFTIELLSNFQQKNSTG